MDQRLDLFKDIDIDPKTHDPAVPTKKDWPMAVRLYRGIGPPVFSGHTEVCATNLSPDHAFKEWVHYSIPRTTVIVQGAHLGSLQIWGSGDPVHPSRPTRPAVDQTG